MLRLRQLMAREKEESSQRRPNRILKFLGPILFVSVGALPGQDTPATQAIPEYVYVAPNVVQARRTIDIFTTFAITNTTEYWFNPEIYLIDSEGEVVRHAAPLLKGFGTWQKSSVALIAEDFNGSVWIVSPHPIVATAMIHQASDESLTLLGNTGLELLASQSAESVRQRLTR